MPTSKLINKTTKQGIAAIKAANLELRYWLTIDAAPKKIDSKYLQTVYEKYVHTRYEAEIGAYFRVLYNILRRLKDDKILSDDEKEQYANLLRGQLTSHELILAGINSCHPVAKNLHLYIKHFQLLKYAPRGRLREIILSVHGKGMVEKPRTASPGLLKRLSNLLQFPKSSAR
ncbi:putative phage abortive infection protein [Rhizobium sp. NFR03]|uniref:putative phage abortive infection protein n=1 Tax=Rhizobium sp. NFR03 TaxID=1566263 RepID=UPI000B865744|nr:putative phage abortive infection protein [Rhizobium sp. NFR03]